MVFKNFRLNIVVRVALLALTLGALLYCILSYRLTSAIIILSALTILQIGLLIRFLEKTNMELIRFLNAIRFDDFSVNYSPPRTGSAFDELNKEFTKVMKKFQELRAEKEANYHYFRTIVQHIGIGIISIRQNGEIEMINTAAKRLLRVNQLRHLTDLQLFSSELLRSLEQHKKGGKDLVKIEKDGEVTQLSVNIIELVIQGEIFRLVSLQNIHSELEEKEMEAWQKLVRVLTHEIINSVTPISSLAATAGEELMHYLCEDEDYCSIPKDDLEDIHLGVETIRKRSIGLINFVTDFRNLARVPEPKLKVFSVKEMFNRIALLMKAELEERNVQLSVLVDPASLQLTADPEQIEQVLINLIKNAIQAFGDQAEKYVKLTAAQGFSGKTIVQVKDNGPGIEEEAIKKIFIPFFTTKKSGSGIGLSISRQIMRLHKGNIAVQSDEKDGTLFTLTF
jgi:two-component system nitrogen regulation sensor histidine kinase NtrY